MHVIKWEIHTARHWGMLLSWQHARLDSCISQNSISYQKFPYGFTSLSLNFSFLSITDDDLIWSGDYVSLC